MKMTSAIDSPRSILAGDSPMTQRTASITLDLPQPLGPIPHQITRDVQYTIQDSERDTQSRIGVPIAPIEPLGTTAGLVAG